MHAHTCEINMQNMWMCKEPCMVDVELKTGEDEIVTTAVPCILPEQILEFLLTKCDLDIDERRCQQYWDHLERHNDEVAVDSKQFRNLQDKQVYPLGIHGDEANMGIISQPYSKIIGMTLNIPIYRPKSTRISRFLMFALESASLVDVIQTVNPILERVVASLNRCTESGVGEGNRKFILTEVRGDQAWLYFLFQHKARWNAVNVCFRCGAHTKPDRDCYALYDAGSTCRNTTKQFIINELPNTLSPLEYSLVFEHLVLTCVFFWDHCVIL